MPLDPSMHPELFMSECESEVIYLENVMFKLFTSIISFFKKSECKERNGYDMAHREWKMNMFFYSHLGVCARIKLLIKVSKYKMGS